ncbi:hypothetical protein DFJ63DRAFT_334878 [Scheffersomyces coipomensis]|uniref:uncharacterized protein n=1 Tax=Scheffersomyces coipomensis TaxID=1788519 RepID=UPI00315C5F46
MSNHDRDISKSISKVLELIDDLAYSISLTEENLLFEEVKSGDFEAYGKSFQERVEEVKLDYSIDTNNISNSGEDEAVRIKNFNDGIEDNVKLTVLSSAFYTYISKVFQDKTGAFLPLEKGADTVNVKGHQLKTVNLRLLSKLAVLLDFQIYVIRNIYPNSKPIFYESISRISKLLFSISTSQVEVFWYYIESRGKTIQQHVFNKAAINDRISILEICNSLTDKYIPIDSKGNKSSILKDNFNDRFQYRLRAFISNLFNFEDNTGLNKFFHISQRVPIDLTFKSHFLEDLVTIHRIFNDPYYYLKKQNAKDATIIIEKMLMVLHTFLEEKQKLAVGDQFEIHNSKSEETKKYLTNKFSKLQYYPENYLKTAFTSSNPADVLKEDRDYFNDLSKEPKVILEYIIMISILCGFYFELTRDNKADFIKQLGAPSSIKHITEDFCPDTIKGKLYKMKKEIINEIKSVDSSLAFLIQSLNFSDKVWCGWLLFGKDPKTNKPLFDDKLLTEKDLQDAVEKLTAYLPFKNKKYFNTYVTPQLSRKMKIERGLNKLENYDIEMNEVDARDVGEESINLQSWKKFRKARRSQWLSFGELVKPDTLGEIVSLDRKRPLIDDEDDSNTLTKKQKV